MYSWLASRTHETETKRLDLFIASQSISAWHERSSAYKFWQFVAKLSESRIYNLAVWIAAHTLCLENVKTKWNLVLLFPFHTNIRLRKGNKKPVRSVVIVFQSKLWIVVPCYVVCRTTSGSTLEFV